MKKTKYSVMGVLVFGVSLGVLAVPATRVQVNPSSIFIYAKNTEDRAYVCSIAYTWSHDDFGTRRSQTVSTTANVPKGFDGVIHSLTGSYVRVQMESGPNISCT